MFSSSLIISSLLASNELGVNPNLVPLDPIIKSVLVKDTGPSSSLTFSKNTLLLPASFLLPCWSVGTPQYVTPFRNSRARIELSLVTPSLGLIKFLATFNIASYIAVASFFVCSLFLSFTYPVGVSKNTDPSGVLYVVVPLLTFVLVVGTYNTKSLSKLS